MPLLEQAAQLQPNALLLCWERGERKAAALLTEHDTYVHPFLGLFPYQTQDDNHWNISQKMAFKYFFLPLENLVQKSPAYIKTQQNDTPPKSVFLKATLHCLG